MTDLQAVSFAFVSQYFQYFFATPSFSFQWKNFFERIFFERIFFRFRFENSFASELKNKLFVLLFFEQFPWHPLAMEMEAPKQSWRKLLHYTTYLTFSPHFLSPPLYLILSLHPLHFLFSFSKDIVFSYFFLSSKLKICPALFFSSSEGSSRGQHSLHTIQKRGIAFLYQSSQTAIFCKSTWTFPGKSIKAPSILLSPGR